MAWLWVKVIRYAAARIWAFLVGLVAGGVLVFILYDLVR